MVERWHSWDLLRLAFFAPEGWRVQRSPGVVAVSSPSSPRRLEARVIADQPLPLPEWSTFVASVLRQLGGDSDVVHAAEDGAALLRGQREAHVSYDVKLPVVTAGRQLDCGEKKL